MFASGDIFGWRSAIGQTAFALAPTAVLLGAGYVLGSPAAAFLAAAPLLLYLTLQKTYALVVIFVAFSYLRLHEAYPPLADIPIIGLTGAGMIVGLMWRGFRLRAAGENRVREFKVLSLIFSMASVATGMAMQAGGGNYATGNGFLLGTLSILFISAAMACWHQLLKRGAQDGWPRVMDYFTYFFIFTSLCVPFAFDPGISFMQFITIWWKIGVVVYSIGWFARSERDFGLTLSIVMLAGLAIAGVAIYNKLNGIDLIEGSRVTIGLKLFAPENPIIPLDPSQNYSSALGDPNELSLVLLFPLGFAAALLFYRVNRFMTLLAFVTLAASVLAIIYTESRGGLLGLLAVGGVIGLKVTKSRALLISAGAIAAIGLFIAMGLSDRATAVGEDGGLDNSSMGRVYSWMAATNMFLDNPITGVGMQSFISAHTTGGYEIELTGFNKAVHSTWFGVLAEGGLPGIILFIAMFAAAVRATRHSLKRFEELGGDPRLIACALGLLGGLAGFAVAGAFLTHGFTWPIYFQIGLSIALWRHVRRLERRQAEAAEEAQGYEPWRAKRRAEKAPQPATPKPSGAFA